MLCDLDPMCKRLEASNQELEAFSYRAAHDLKTPLNAVRGFAYILGARYADGIPDEGRRLLSYIDRSAAAMETLIDSLLTLSEVGRQCLRREPIDVSDMARDVWGELEVQGQWASDCLYIESELQADGDRGLVRSLLLNLLGNARKYTADRPRPSIALGRRHTARGQAFCVQDNGVGFAASDAEPRLFTPFVRFHDGTRYTGHGLGLATCMRIVRYHGGDIWLESQPGCGASVYFTLEPPVSEVTAAALAPAAPCANCPARCRTAAGSDG